MKVNDFISENYHDLEFFSSSQKKNYLLAEPFPNIEVNNFFNQTFLDKVLKEFPNLANLEKSNKYINKNEIKYANNQYDLFPEIIKTFLDFLNSPTFLKFIQNITAIKENLVADKELNGGVNPNSALMKCLMLNSADDIGNPGPDFKHGWGEVNAFRAIKILENGNYLNNSVSQGLNNQHLLY